MTRSPAQSFLSPPTDFGRIWAMTSHKRLLRRLRQPQDDAEKLSREFGFRIARLFAA